MRAVGVFIATTVAEIAGCYFVYLWMKKAALARLIERCRADASFYRGLKSAALRRRALFAPGAERAALKRLLLALPARARGAETDGG